FGLRGPGVGEPEVAAEATADPMDVDLARIVAVFILFERELEGPRVGPRAAAVRSDRGHVVRDVIDDLGVGRQPVQGAPRGIAGGVLLVLVSGVETQQFVAAAVVAVLLPRRRLVVPAPQVVVAGAVLVCALS